MYLYSKKMFIIFTNERAKFFESSWQGLSRHSDILLIDILQMQPHSYSDSGAKAKSTR